MSSQHHQQQQHHQHQHQQQQHQQHHNQQQHHNNQQQQQQQQQQQSIALSSLPNRQRMHDMNNQQSPIGRPDVTIACEGGSINAHRSVLASRSCYLRRLLLEFSERYANQRPVVILNDLKLQDIRQLINYMYSNKLNVPFEPSSSIEQAAKILCIDSLLGIRSEHNTTYNTDVHRVIALDQRFDQMGVVDLPNEHNQHTFVPQSLANLDHDTAAAAAPTSMRASTTIPIHNLGQCASGSQPVLGNALIQGYIDPSGQSAGPRKKRTKQSPSKLALPPNLTVSALAHPFVAHVNMSQNRSGRGHESFPASAGPSNALVRSDPNKSGKQQKKSKAHLQAGSSNSYIDAHMPGLKPRARCPWCAKSLSSKYNLGRHIKNVHGTVDKNDMPIISVGKYKLCPICSKTMSSKFNLQRHMKKIHEGVIPSLLSGSNKRQPKNPAKLKVCQYCNKTLSHKYNLERHIRNVHGVQSEG